MDIAPRTVPTPRLDLIGLVVSDMAASLAFCRRLGLEVPEGGEEASHVEVVLAGGVRFAWDTEEVVRSFDPGWTRSGGGHRIEPAFRCGVPADVDALYGSWSPPGTGGSVTRWCSIRTGARCRCSPTPTRPCRHRASCP